MTDDTEKTEPEATEPEAKPAAKKPARKKAEPKTEAVAEATEDTAETAEKAKPAAKKPARKPAAKKEPAAEKKPASRSRGKVKTEDEAPRERVTVRAHAKYVRTSARKARLVCDHIRGKSVEEAFAILAHTPRHVAEDWRKLLQSAVANAEHNHELIGDDLRIASVTADEGPTLKRFRPRAMGRATRIRKRTSHLTITLTPKD
jgi:ribosomal protein L22